MTGGLIASLGGWSWIILGLILLALEVFAPGASLLWLGLAALVTGLLALAMDMTWQTQTILFAVLSLAAVVFWWRVVRTPSRANTELPLPHNRAELQVGREFVLEEPIVNGAGRVRIDDTIWRIAGPDLAAGTKVRVASTDGPLLKVVAA